MLPALKEGKEIEVEKKKKRGGVVDR